MRNMGDGIYSHDPTEKATSMFLLWARNDPSMYEYCEELAFHVMEGDSLYAAAEELEAWLHDFASELFNPARHRTGRHSDGTAYYSPRMTDVGLSMLADMAGVGFLNVDWHKVIADWVAGIESEAV